MRKTNRAGIELMHEFESCQLEAYLCPAKVWTIGWGNTFYADGSRVKQGDKITQKEADELYYSILRIFEEQADHAIKSNVNENQFSAFVSALSNIGPGHPNRDGLIRLRNGNPSTLLRMINANPNDPLIADEFKKWRSKGTPFEKGLLRRRTREAELYFS